MILETWQTPSEVRTKEDKLRKNQERKSEEAAQKQRRLGKDNFCPEGSISPAEKDLLWGEKKNT